MVKNLLKGTRAYLSGPMDFVGSRIIEKYYGWRSLLTPVLKALGSFVLDPWNKPVIRGHENYGQEGVIHSKEEYAKDFWTNEKTRAQFEVDFWETVHIDLRMTDLSDFLIAFCPTNIYSVGTVHEIVTARLQWKPTLVISPPVSYDLFPEIKALPPEAQANLKYYGLKENPHGIPSQWYGNIVGGNYFFDGFGWENLKFKSDTFYEDLIHNVMEIAKPPEENTEDYKQWERVKEWVDNSGELEELKGSVLKYLNVVPEEKDLLAGALKGPVEQKREYFWYNVPYTPKRPLLYQIFNIASGYIPPRTQIVTKRDDEGNITYEASETIDDGWLIISHAEDN